MKDDLAVAERDAVAGAQRGRLIVVYWLPAVLWAVLVLLASSDLFSSSHSADWIGEIIIRVVGHPLPPRQFNVIHFAVRKSAHLAEYFILGALLFRAARGDARGWRGRWAAAAIALAAAVAALDEWHQLFVPSRTGTAWDMVIDVAGSAVAQLVARFRSAGVPPAPTGRPARSR